MLLPRGSAMAVHGRLLSLLQDFPTAGLSYSGTTVRFLDSPLRAGSGRAGYLKADLPRRFRRTPDVLESGPGGE